MRTALLIATMLLAACGGDDDGDVGPDAGPFCSSFAECEGVYGCDADGECYCIDNGPAESCIGECSMICPNDVRCTEADGCRCVELDRPCEGD